MAKIIALRQGPDGVEGTSDDILVEDSRLNMNIKEQTIFLSIKGWTGNVSNFFRMISRGTDEGSQISTRIEAVINRDNLTVVYWRKE